MTPITEIGAQPSEMPVSEAVRSVPVSEEPLAGEIAVDPATGRPAGRPQALVLLLSSCLAVLGAVLLAPVLPRIQDAFEGTPGVEALTPIVLTAPALVIGLTATFAGRIVDRVGRKRLLVGALVAYAFVGTAPLWLPSLELIVVSRVLVGLTEAAIMTCCTTLLADYFHGSQRDRYFGLQVVYTTVAATIFFAVGGALGAQNWRTPFWLYAVSLPLAFFAARYIWQPAPQALHRTGKLPALPWRQLAAPVGVTLLGGLVFYVLIVELSFKLDDIGVESPATIGAVSAVASLGTAVGAFLFGRLATLGPAVLVPLSFGISGIGLIGLALGAVRAGGRRRRGRHRVRQRAAPAVAAHLGARLAHLRAARPRNRGLDVGPLHRPVRRPAGRPGASAGPSAGSTSALLVLGAVAVAAAVGVRLAGPSQAAEPALAAH